MLPGDRKNLSKRRTQHPVTEASFSYQGYLVDSCRGMSHVKPVAILLLAL